MSTDHEIYATGRAWCDTCGDKWIAVWPLGADDLQCPNCHSTDTDREQGETQ